MKSLAILVLGFLKFSLPILVKFLTYSSEGSSYWNFNYLSVSPIEEVESNKNIKNNRAQFPGGGGIFMEKSKLLN